MVVHVNTVTVTAKSWKYWMGCVKRRTLNIPVQVLSNTDDLWVLVVVGNCIVVVAAAAGNHRHTLVVLGNYYTVVAAAAAVVVETPHSLRILRKEEVH